MEALAKVKKSNMSVASTLSSSVLWPLIGGKKRDSESIDFNCVVTDFGAVIEGIDH